MRNMLLSGVLLSVAGAAAPGVTMSKPLAVIHYRSDGHLMLLPVMIGGRREWFVFDSGAPHVVIDPRLSVALNLRPMATGAVSGTGAGSVALTHLPPVTVRLGSLALRSADPWQIDLSAVPISPDVRGLIGADLWKRYVVKMDPASKTLTMFDAARYRPDPSSAVVPLIIEGDKMYVSVTLDVKPGLSVTHKLRIDTGAEETVNDPIVGEAVITRSTTVGNGLGANYVAKSGVLDAVHLGPFTIRQVWGPGGTGPAIGMEIFRRFVTTFDAPHGRMYLTPNAAFNDPVPAPPG